MAMQKPLALKTYEIPEGIAPQAKDLCETLVQDLEKTHAFYKQQIAFLKQQYLIALRSLRPNMVSVANLRELFDESEMIVDPTVSTEIDDPDDNSRTKKKKKKKKSAIPEDAPRTIVEHDVPESQRTCSEDGSQLSPMGYDVKLELKYKPATLEVIEHRYPKYGCSLCKGAVVRQPPAPSLIPQSYASSELLAHIAVAKFCDHLPLYRQEQIFSRLGIHLTRQVMADWIIKLGQALNPLIGIIHERILESPVVSADETPVKVLTKDGVRTSAKAYMWQISRWGPHPLILFEFDMSRRKEVAERLLGAYVGYVQSDAYAGYNVLFGDGSPRTRVGCMAHVFRRFKDFVATLKKEHRKGHPATKAIRWIDSLYDIEKECRGQDADARKAHRLSRGAEKILDELMEFVASERLSVSTASPYYDALKYADDELPHVRQYLREGFIEIDNNLAENAIRPFALGRRNWLFMCTEDGAQASANIYSLIMTAKANGVDPYTYLTKVIARLPLCQSLEDYEEILPV
jgi:transposase